MAIIYVRNDGHRHLTPAVLGAMPPDFTLHPIIYLRHTDYPRGRPRLHIASVESIEKQSCCDIYEQMETGADFAVSSFTVLGCGDDIFGPLSFWLQCWPRSASGTIKGFIKNDLNCDFDVGDL